MQVQTLTLTTERAQIGGDLLKRYDFEQRTTALCDCCDSQATGTENALKTQGWHLGQNEQFCPECNY